MQLVARRARHDGLDDKGAATALLNEQALLDERANALLHSAARKVQHGHKLVLRRDALVNTPFLGVNLLANVVCHLHIEQGGVLLFEVRHTCLLPRIRLDDSARMVWPPGAPNLTNGRSLPRGACAHQAPCRHKSNWSTIVYLRKGRVSDANDIAGCTALRAFLTGNSGYFGMSFGVKWPCSQRILASRHVNKVVRRLKIQAMGRLTRTHAAWRRQSGDRRCGRGHTRPSSVPLGADRRPAARPAKLRAAWRRRSGGRRCTRWHVRTPRGRSPRETGCSRVCQRCGSPGCL